MRPVPLFHWRYPDVRAVRIALAAGAVAGLIVIAACTDNGGKSITAPSSGPRNATIQTGTLLNATFAKVCVDAGAPLGTYKFTNSFLRRMNKGMGGDGTTTENNPDWNRVWAAGALFRVGALTNLGGPTTPKTSDAILDPAGNIQEVTIAGTSGGAAPLWNPIVGGTTADGSVTWTNRGLAEYEVARGTCVTVLTRTFPTSKFCNRLVSPPEGPGCGPAPTYVGVSGETNEDPYSGVVVTNTTRPAGVTYNHTDCLLDQGVQFPKDAFRDGGHPFGNDNDPGNPCGTNNNPSTVFANIQHGMQLTFFFGLGPSSSCPDGEISAGFNGTAVAAGRTLWFVANLKPSGPIVDGTTISFNNSVINLNGTNLPGPLPSGVVTYSAAATTATTTFALNTWTTTVPLSWDKDVFLAGAQYLLPAILAGGADVTWTGAFSSNTPGVKAKWQFSAAAYNGFNADYSLLGVKPIPSNTLAPPWFNSDKGGTPESYKNNVVGGAMGGGGGNFIGSYSATKAICVAN